MFRRRQQLRRWAAGVLFLWLFGVGTGVANACLASNIGEPTGDGSGYSTALRAVHHAAQPAADASHHGSHHGSHHTHHDGTPDHQEPTAKSNCQDFCDKAGVSIPTLKSALDDVQGHAPPPPAVAATLAVPAFSPVQRWAPRRDGVRAPPIPIAFLRLAL